MSHIKTKFVLGWFKVTALTFFVLISMRLICTEEGIKVPNDYHDSTVVWIKEDCDHKEYPMGSFLEVINSNLILATYDSSAQEKNCRVAHLISFSYFTPPNDSLTGAFVYDTRINQPYGLDSVWMWMLQNRGILDSFTIDSMGVYVCLFHRFYTINKDGSVSIPLPTGETRMLTAWDSLNEACCAINYGHYYNEYFYNGYDLSEIDSIFESVVAHEIGHAFHANEAYEGDTAHCSSSNCVMYPFIFENSPQGLFCNLHRPNLKNRKP